MSPILGANADGSSDGRLEPGQVLITLSFVFLHRAYHRTSWASVVTEVIGLRRDSGTIRVLDAGFRVGEVETFCSTDEAPFVNVQRYVSSGGDLF